MSMHSNRKLFDGNTWEVIVKGRGEKHDTSSSTFDDNKSWAFYIPKSEALFTINEAEKKVPKNIFSSHEALHSAFAGELSRTQRAKSFAENLISFYNKIKYLMGCGYSFGILTLLPLKIVDDIYRNVQTIKSGVEDNSITPEFAEKISKDMQNIAKNFVNLLCDSSKIDIPTSKWPEDKIPGEKALEFLKRCWGDLITNGTVSRSSLRTQNLALYQALSTHFRRNEVPKELISWWETSSVRTKKEVDARLKELGINKPEEAFQKGLDTPEAHRLYNASLRRQT